MQTRTKLLLCAASILALGACSKASNTEFFAESGAETDEGAFGNPTMNNYLVMTGQQSYVMDMGRKFSDDIPSMVNFPFNSTVLDSEAQSILMKQADWMRQFPEVRFQVFGHTDLVGSDEYNRSLGMRRAEAVVAFLASQGISRARVVAVVSEGESQPLIVTEGQERRNRRTVTDVSGFVSSHPMVMNGKYAAIIFRDYVNSAGEATSVTEASSGADGAGG